MSSNGHPVCSTQPSLLLDTYDLLVIGGGIVGLACARAIALRHPEKRILLVEAESQVAQHQSSRNSGVIHAGIYYAPGSARAKLCQAGAESMLAYCESRGLPAQKVGKLIVASTPEEIKGLEVLMERGMKNGCKDLTFVDSAGIQRLEPAVRGVRAILSPHTGIADFGAVAASYAKEFGVAGGHVLMGFEVKKARRAETSQETAAAPIEITSAAGQTVRAHRILTCAGLYADRVASIFGAPSQPSIVPVRGSWLQLKPSYASIVRRNIYPVPNPAFPFLGVHFTPTMGEGGSVEGGGMLVGPNAMLATSREGYSLTDFNLRDVLDMVRDESLRAMIRKHWRFGFRQLKEELFPSLALAACQQYVPSLRWEHLQLYRPISFLPYERPLLRSGVRAQAMAPDGRLEEDFVIQEQHEIGSSDKPSSTDASGSHSSILHIRNAPSPAATSSLAIAAVVQERATKAFGW